MTGSVPLPVHGDELGPACAAPRRVTRRVLPRLLALTRACSHDRAQLSLDVSRLRISHRGHYHQRPSTAQQCLRRTCISPSLPSRFRVRMPIPGSVVLAYAHRGSHTEIPAADVIIKAGREVLDSTHSWKQGKSYQKNAVKTSHRAKGPKDGTAWYCRASEHTKKDATFDEFWSKLGQNRAENEMQYAPATSRLRRARADADNPPLAGSSRSSRK